MYTNHMETIVFWTLLSLAVAIVALMVLLIIRARSVGPRHKRMGLSAEQLVSALDSMD